MLDDLIRYAYDTHSLTTRRLHACMQDCPKHDRHCHMFGLLPLQDVPHANGTAQPTTDYEVVFMYNEAAVAVELELTVVPQWVFKLELDRQQCEVVQPLTGGAAARDTKDRHKLPGVALPIQLQHTPESVIRERLAKANRTFDSEAKKDLANGNHFSYSASWTDGLSVLLDPPLLSFESRVKSPDGMWSPVCASFASISHVHATMCVCLIAVVHGRCR